MRLLKVDKDYKCISEIKRIYEESIPENERLPFGDLMYAEGVNCELFSIVDDCGVVGFMHVRLFDKIAYLVYYGIDEKFRNKGKGSEALRLLSDYYKDAVIVLCVEKPLKDGDIRTRRIGFYKRNGFSVADYEFDVVGDTYYTMYKGQFNKDKFFELLMICFPDCKNFRPIS